MGTIEEILKKLRSGSIDLATAFALAANDGSGEIPVTQDGSSSSLKRG